MRIANPKWSCAGFKSVAQAGRYVRDGLAKMMPDGSLFLCDDFRRDAMVQTPDARGLLATVEQITSLPVAGHIRGCTAAVRLLTKPTTPRQQSPQRAAAVQAILDSVRPGRRRS